MTHYLLLKLERYLAYIPTIEKKGLLEEKQKQASMAYPLIWVQVSSKALSDGSISSSVLRTGLKQDSPLLGLQACHSITYSFSAIYQFLDPSFTFAFPHSLPLGCICVACKGTRNLLKGWDESSYWSLKELRGPRTIPTLQCRNLHFALMRPIHSSSVAVLSWT